MITLDYPDNNDDINPLGSSLISDCCHSESLGPVNEDAYGNLIGVCSDCKSHTTFSTNPDNDL